MTRQATGGGRFDPSAGPLYFAAGHLEFGDSLVGTWTVCPNVLYPMNQETISSGEHLDLVCAYEPAVNIFVDSGIFTLTNDYARANGVGMDDALQLAPDEIPGFDKLWEDYVRVVPQYEDRLWGYIELDQGGAENKKRTRGRLEALGIHPIPVYHPLLDGWDYFDELCQGYDRICFGNVVQAEYGDRVKLLRTMWERKLAYPDVWIHLLGMTPTPMLLTYPPNSCDSSAWVMTLKYGRLHSYIHTNVWPPGHMGPEWAYDPASDDHHNDPAGYARAGMFASVEAGALGHAWDQHVKDQPCPRW